MALHIAAEERPAVHYIGAPFTSRFAEFGAPGGPNQAIPRIYQWLAEHQIAPLGGPLYVYRHIGGPDDAVDLTVAVPIAAPSTPSEGLVLGELPAGTYVVGRHTGGPDAIPAAYEEVRTWATDHGHRLAAALPMDCGGQWTGHAEHFLTDPIEEPDPSKWVTDLLFKTA
ncbi:MAG: GyrI-like domain-containing protein [Brachybacterium sp.]|nr:GyrI-like domain-containing protein [Brachybacterium sp.]